MTYKEEARVSESWKNNELKKKKNEENTENQTLDWKTCCDHPQNIPLSIDSRCADRLNILIV